ncbi:MAG: hypothetical protein MJZ34_05120 [Paludibacteraceae bacterium]|nr:hypothetical protein [Paludibacteraceae bacterium]
MDEELEEFDGSNLLSNSDSYDGNKTKVYSLLNDYGYDVEDIDDETGLPKFLARLVDGSNYDEICKFNYNLLKIHKKHHIPMTAIIMILEEDFLDYKELLGFIQINLLTRLRIENKKEKTT